MQRMRALETLSSEQGASNKPLLLELMEPSGLEGMEAIVTQDLLNTVGLMHR